jgi:hypothetical protein
MQRKGGKNNWIGIIIFLVIMFGSPLSSFLAGVIRQSTGVTVSPSLLLGGFVILAVLASFIGSALRGLGRINSSSETKLPTVPISPPQMSAPPRPPVAPPAIRSPGAPQMKQPQFEPIIDPRILVVGIVGLILFGGAFVAILAIAGGI